MDVVPAKPKIRVTVRDGVNPALRPHAVSVETLVDSGGAITLFRAEDLKGARLTPVSWDVVNPCSVTGGVGYSSLTLLSSGCRAVLIAPCACQRGRVGGASSLRASDRGRSAVGDESRLEASHHHSLRLRRSAQYPVFEHIRVELGASVERLHPSGRISVRLRVALMPLPRS
jgi:hypothetical protein